MTVAIIGAGISGVACGKILQEKGVDCVIFEKSDRLAGLARTKMIDGIPYHLTGGHCFNSKYSDVLDFVFKTCPREEWNVIERIAKIDIDGHLIDYPIEFNIGQLERIDADLPINIIKDLCSSGDVSNVPHKTLEDWFIAKFGKTLAKQYFIPYNTKIWGVKPSQMSSSWVADKLPNPSFESIIRSLYARQEDKMPHLTFYYHKSNDQNTFIRKLAEGLKIEFSTPVNNIKRIKDGFLVNGEFYSQIINTSPLNTTHLMLDETDFDQELLEASNKLTYNKVSSMLWSARETEQTWTYLPQDNTIFHRHIHIGNFLKPKRNAIITEAIGERSYDEMYESGKQHRNLIDVLDYHISDHAYVVFDENYKTFKSLALAQMEKLGIIQIGRFAEWEYYNMDVCIKSAIDSINNNF